MRNPSIEQRAIEAVKRYEARHGRKTERRFGVGFDLCSGGKGGHRHIEVKGTLKSTFTRRWLEAKEYKVFRADSRFWLYLVTNVGARPKVHVIDRQTLGRRYVGPDTKYLFKFNAEDFEA